MIPRPEMNRRTFLEATSAVASVTILGACAGRRPLPAQASAAPAIRNPLIRQRADTQIFRHDDGQYYMMASVPEYDRLIIRRAPTIAELAAAPEAVVWRRPAAGKLGGHIWAPELHRIDGRWHIYFAAGDSDDRFRIRTYVLRCDGADALDAPWSMLGQFEAPWDSFNLDSTIFEHKGTRYISWAQHEPGIATNSNLYLAPLASPTRLARPPVRLTVPTLPWEIQGFKVAEGPAPLARNGRLFLTYSASATDARYCLGLLTADADADIMRAEAWTKSPEPVFVSSPVTQVYGPGHNSFTVDEQGRDVIVYHGRDYERIEGDPLYDPNRHTRVQRIYYHADGTPDFGIPVGNGEVPDRFSPIDRPGLYLAHASGNPGLAAGPLPATQFRQKESSGGTVALEPITAPGKLLCASPDGTIRLAEAANADAGACNFRRFEGLAGQGLSFALAARPDHFLGHDDGRLRIGLPGDGAGRTGATFTVS